MVNDHRFARRRALLGAGASGLALAALGAPLRVSAEERAPTVQQSLGPFYPYEAPIEKDADLVTVRGGTVLAKGEIALVSGRVVDARGRPVADARVEIWQCNALGRYHHPRDRSSAPLDPNFQGYGETVTTAEGVYRFRAIKPVPYPGRTPHIHFRISGRDVPLLVTQMYVAGEPLNDTDVLLSGIFDPRARAGLIVPFERMPGAPTLEAKFDIVLASNGTLRRG